MNPSNLLLQSQFNYMYPNYSNSYQHSPFNQIRPTLPTNTNLTLSPSSSMSNLKSTRSPSLSPSSSSPDDEKYEMRHNSYPALSPGFPRHSSIDSISSKFNRSAKIDSNENNEHLNKMNDENNNPIKLAPTRSPNGSIVNDIVAHQNLINILSNKNQ